MNDEVTAVRTAVDLAPGSIRALARDAGISPRLVTLIRDGKRRLTAETKRALVEALRRREDRCREARAALEAVSPAPRRRGEAEDDDA